MSLSDSRFNMWRGVVAVMHADGNVHEKERALIDNYFGRLPLSDSQYKTLKEDLKVPQSAEAMFDKVTAPEDRADLVNFAHLMFWSDGELDQDEESLYARLCKKAMAKVDSARLAALKKEADAEVEKHRAEIEAINANTSPVVCGISWLLRGAGN